MKYTDQELIDELHRVSEEHCDGEAPKLREMDEYSMCSAGTYKSRFDSWNELLKENGYLPNLGKPQMYSDEDLVNEIKRVNDICEGTPSQSDMKEHGDISIPTYNERFGGWNESLKAAGFEVAHEKFIDKEKLLDDIKTVSENYCGGDPPTCNQMRKHGEYSVVAYFNRFGSWDNALDELNMEIDLRDFTNEELLDDLIEVSEKYCNGNPPKSDELEKHTEHSTTIYYNRFGGFENALEKAGIPKEEITKDDLIEELHRLEDEYDCRPKQKLMTNEGKYAVNTYHRRFGSWDNGLVEAGFDSWEYPTGEDHPTWEGGSDRYYGSSWCSKRREAIKRDEFKCRLCSCGEDERLIDVHHITPVRYWDIDSEHRKMNSLNNLISLCRTCHNKFEGKFMGRSHKEYERLVKENLM